MDGINGWMNGHIEREREWEGVEGGQRREAKREPTDNMLLRKEREGKREKPNERTEEIDDLMK